MDHAGRLHHEWEDRFPIRLARKPVREGWDQVCGQWLPGLLVVLCNGRRESDSRGLWVQIEGPREEGLSSARRNPVHAANV